MRPRKRLLGFLFILLLFLPFLSFAEERQILIYRDFMDKGDETEAHGIAELISPTGTNIREFRLGQEKALQTTVQRLSSNQKPIVVAIGENTVHSFSLLVPLKNAVTVHVCHMKIPAHDQLIGKVDFIALPDHAVGSFEALLKDSTTKLIKTRGVAHNRRRKKVDNAYQAKKHIFPVNIPYVAVVLAGDATTPEGNTLFFTKKSAQELARWMMMTFKNHYFFVINGPRTGQYNPDTGEKILTAHSDGKIDFVTDAFLDELKREKVPFYLFDFQFGNSSDDMEVILGALRQRGGTILIPGESSSTIAESIDLLSPNSVIVYENTAMDAVHEAYVQSEFEKGRLKFLKGLVLKEPKWNKPQSIPRLAKEQIVSELLSAE